MTCRTADWLNTLESPQMATALLTYACSNDCVFCGPSEKRDQTKGKAANRSDIIDWIDRCSEEGVSLVVFSGAADPFTHPSIADFIKKVRSMKMHPFCYTQAHIGPRKVQQVVDSGLTEVMVSVHGHNSEIHEINTQSKGSFNRTIKGLKLLKEAGLYIMTNTVVTQYNIDYLYELMEFLAVELDVDEMAFSYPRIEGSVKKNLKCIPEFESSAKKLSPILKRLRQLGKRVTVEYMPYCYLPKEQYDLMPDYNTMYKDDLYDIMIKPSEVEWSFTEKCSSCIHKDAGCQGVDKHLPFLFKPGEFYEKVRESY